MRLVPVCFFLLACGGGAPTLDAAVDGGLADGAAEADGGPRDWPAMEVPETTEPETGIVRQVVRVDGHVPPANPTTLDETPSVLNRVQIVRYRARDTSEARAVIIAIPGLLGGAGSFDALARHLVRRAAAAGEPIEVWAIDRRSNLLEDLRGLDAAEALSEPDAARGYYFRRETVGGRAFDGFLGQTDVPYMSEWGLATQLEDVRAVLMQVPEAERKTRVFLLGHSLGASMTEAFAAWRFGDTPGASMVAGLVLVDGAASEAPITESEYREGTGGGFMTVPGVDAIRASTRFLELPLLGVAVHVRAEIAALSALVAPEAVEVDRGRAEVLATLMSTAVRNIPSMSNAAAFGFAFDSCCNGLSFAAVSMGQSSGGPLEAYDSLFGSRLLRPSDRDATYTWVDALDAEPPELTPYANLAHSWADGRTNFAEWYFPLRLALDLAAVGGLAVPASDWQAQEGLRAFDGALVDAPILAIAAALVPPDRFEAARARAAPIGPGRPNAGATRDMDVAFRVVDATSMTHIDPLTGADVAANPVPGAVLEFVLANAASGRVSVSLP